MLGTPWRAGVRVALVMFATLGPARAEITPEAERIVDALHARLGDVRTLTWRTTGTYGEKNGTGAYVRGIGLRLDSTRLYDSDPTEVYVLADRQLAVHRATGVVVSGPQLATLPNLSFVLPLLDKAQLATLGRWEAATARDASEQALRLVRDASRSGARTTTEYVYRLPDYRLVRVTSAGGWGHTTQIVTTYTEAGGYSFPVRWRSSIGAYDAGGSAVADVKANESIPDSRLRPDLTGLIAQRPDLTATELEAQLKTERGPLARAGLAYSLALALQSAEVGATGTSDRVQNAARLAVELAPEALAPRLLLGGIVATGKPEEAEQFIDNLLRRFPERRALVYQRLLWPRLAVVSWISSA